MVCRPVQDGTHMRVDDHQTHEREGHQPPVLVYCLVSGVIATTAATGLSFTVSGAASFAIWVSVLILLCVLAGFGYDSSLLRVVWAARRQQQRR